MRQASHRERGFTLNELLIIVGMMGLVTLVSIPALNQLLPQYRTRAAASEVAASLRMIRTQAMSTRSDYRMTVNPDPSCECYALAQSRNGTWIPIGENGRPTPYGDVRWKRLYRVDLAGTSVYTITMERDGTASAPVDIVLDAVKPQSAPKYDRYTVGVSSSGYVAVVPSKK